jgi:hypothetical protein
MSKHVLSFLMEGQKEVHFSNKSVSINTHQSLLIASGNIYDTFQNEEGRKSHLSGKIAQALVSNAPELLVDAPVIEPLDVLAVKTA